MSLVEIIEQLEASAFEGNNGSLESHPAWLQLREWMLWYTENGPSCQPCYQKQLEKMELQFGDVLKVTVPGYYPQDSVDALLGDLRRMVDVSRFKDQHISVLVVPQYMGFETENESKQREEDQTHD